MQVISPRVFSDDPTLQQLFETWLRNAQMTWPEPFTIVVLSGDRCPFAPDTRDILRQPDLTVQAGAPGDTVRITWEHAPAVAEVSAWEPRATVWMSAAAIEQFERAERSVLLVMLIFLMRRIGWYHVHAASLVDRRGRGWLIAGNSRCGKSTTTALMATRGWQIATDDIGFLARDDARVASVGMRTPVALREGGLALIGATGGIDMTRRQKTGFWPEDLGGSWTSRVIPEIVAFPTLGARTTLTPATPREALAALVQWSVWVLFEPVFAQEHLDALGHVARQSRCFHLTLGPDLFENPDLLEELAS